MTQAVRAKRTKLTSGWRPLAASLLPGGERARVGRGVPARSARMARAQPSPASRGRPVAVQKTVSRCAPRSCQRHGEGRPPRPDAAPSLMRPGGAAGQRRAVTDAIISAGALDLEITSAPSTGGSPRLLTPCTVSGRADARSVPCRPGARQMRSLARNPRPRLPEVDDGCRLVDAVRQQQVG